MFSRHSCPECDGNETERVDVVWESDAVIEVRACNDCYAGFEIEYGDPVVDVTHEGEA